MAFATSFDDARPTQLKAPGSSLAERPLPMSVEEMRARGWERVDVVFVTGDAYVDHPSFAMALLGRVLEAAGFRIAIVSQPDWRNCEDWRRFGAPRLFYAISAGNMDSMINHYTANRKVRIAKCGTMMPIRRAPASEGDPTVRRSLIASGLVRRQRAFPSLPEASRHL